MKKLLGVVLALILGVGVGGGSAWGVGMLRQNGGATGTVRTEFVETGPMMAPLVFPDGRLSGYVSFEVQLEVPQGEGDAVKAKLPLLLNAVNLHTYRTPMASGRDGLIPGLDAFRRVVMDAARETYGPDMVRRAVVTQATPA